MKKTECDVCGSDKWSMSTPQGITYGETIKVQGREIDLCASCRNKFVDGIEERLGITVFRDILLEAIRAKLAVSAKSVVPDGKRPFDGQGETVDTSGPDPDLIEDSKMVPAVVAPVEVPTEAELLGVECKCGASLTVANWCQPGVCTKCFKKDLESLPVEPVTEAVA